MPLYLLTKSAGYDQYDACLVRARSPKQAVEIADDECSEHYWRDESTWAEADCRNITVLGKPTTIIASFNAG